MSFMLHPIQAEQGFSTAVEKGLGINQTAVNPLWETPSYTPANPIFKRYTL